MEEKYIVNVIREFNRFYLSALDLLGNHYLESNYTVTEARVLFEVYEANGCNAAHIAKVMNIDKSYLSRIIKKHEDKGYLVRTKSNDDTRSYDIKLTDTGKDITRDFIEKSNRHIEAIIESLDAQECIALNGAFATITKILGKVK